MSNCILDDIEAGRRAYDSMPAYPEESGAAEYRVMLRIAEALERIADSLEANYAAPPLED